jgi:alkylated DNA repair dioxygenase AlkB
VPHQLSLFDEISQPAGFHVEPNFTSIEEESELIRHIRELPLEPFQFGAFEGKRRVASFGSRYDYTTRRLEEANPLPDWLKSSISRIERNFELPDHAIRQILCTEYEIGAGIGWHKDKPHFDQVFGLALQSACRFRFRRMLDTTTWQRLNFMIEPRSLYSLSGDARHAWEHSIQPVAARRYSITFRTMGAE